MVNGGAGHTVQRRRISLGHSNGATGSLSLAHHPPSLLTIHRPPPATKHAPWRSSLLPTCFSLTAASSSGQLSLLPPATAPSFLLLSVFIDLVGCARRASFLGPLRCLCASAAQYPPPMHCSLCVPSLSLTTGSLLPRTMSPCVYVPVCRHVL